jgi:predicted Zn-dependent protease
MLREVVLKGYSREQELDADREGLRLAIAAGFDGDASSSALNRLGQVAPDASGFAAYVSSHPSLSERMRHLKDDLST